MYNLDERGYSPNCSDKNILKHRPYVCELPHSGRSYTAALEHIYRTKSVGVLLESDVTLTSDFDNAVARLLECRDLPLAASFYNPNNARASTFPRARRSSVRRLLSSAACSNVRGVNLTFGTQGYLFTKPFLDKYIDFIDSRRRKDLFLIAPDMQLKRFCKQFRKEVDCVSLETSIVQHSGEFSELFTENSTNTRFHVAKDLPEWHSQILFEDIFEAKAHYERSPSKQR